MDNEEGNEELCIEVDGLFYIELGRLFVEYGIEELTDVVDVIGIVVDVFDDVIGVIDDVIGDIDDVDDVIGVIGDVLDVNDDVLDVLDVIGIVDMGDVSDNIPDDTFVPVLLPTITTAGTFTSSEAFLVSEIIFEASFLRFSICFCVVSTILDSTIASKIWTPVT